MADTTKETTLVVGDKTLVPFRLTSATVRVRCVLLDTRQVYGRTEWLIAPIDGNGQAWVREDSIVNGVAATKTQEN